VVQIIDIWRTTFVKAVVLFKYKGDAFITTITKDTPALTAIDIFIVSGLLSNKEKSIFERVWVAVLGAVKRDKRVVTEELVFLDFGVKVVMDTKNRGLMFSNDLVKKELREAAACGDEREAALDDPAAAAAMAEKLREEALAAVAN
jgi:hypothetical protein